MNENTSQEGYIRVTGGRVWYRIVGSGSGIPLLTLHGGPGASSDYFQPLTALADERPVILYDQLGGGKSDHPDNPALWVLERFVEELAQVRNELGLKQVHLFGHSWGTMLAIEYAFHRPIGVVSLILSGPVLNMFHYLQGVRSLVRELPAEMQVAIEKRESERTTDIPGYRVALTEWIRRHVFRNESFLEEMVKAYEDLYTSQVINTMWGLSEFSCSGNLKDFDRTVGLHELQMPTLFTCGRYDECMPGVTAWYQSRLPGSEIVVFENSAHMTHLEEPELYVQTVRDFLHRVESHMVDSRNIAAA